jgi:protein ImuB
MWWIALYLPQWPLEALGTPLPDAVEEGGHIICVGPAAAQAGVHLGMSLPAAEVRRPGLKVLARRPEQEAQALRMIAMAALRFSPNLHLRPDGFLIEVQSSLRLFGGPLRLWRQLQGVIHEFKVSHYLAAGPFPETAWLLARVRGPGPGQAQARHRRLPNALRLGVTQSRDLQALRPALDALPVPLVLQAWGAPSTTAGLLQGLGVHTLGEWRALPRAGLQRRLGPDAMRLLDAAYGQASDPRAFWAPPPTFDERLDLPERIAELEGLIPALQQLLQALQGWLVAQARLAGAMALHLLHEARRHEPLPDTVHRLQLAAPEQRADALQRLWGERLHRQPLVAPVVALRLVLQASERPETQDLQQALPMATRRQPGSQDPAVTRQALAHLLDRLQARLGEQAVQGLRCRDDHRPERASSTVTLTGPAAALGVADGVPDQPTDGPLRPAPRPTPQPLPRPLPRPLWLLDEPEPLTEHQGRLVHRGTALVLRTRPERIEAGWFDDEPVCRDYYVAEDTDHRLCWIYREHRAQAQGWFLHGWFN